MREQLIKWAGTPPVLITGVLLVFIIIAAMKIPRQQKTYTYLALGDSYTIGEKVAPEENFPNQVTRLLQQHHFDIKSPDIVAKTGWTTDELETGISKAKLAASYDFVTLLIGVNNQYRGRSLDEYMVQFERLLKQAIAFAGNRPDRVIVLSIPDWSVTPFADGSDRKKISAEIDAFNTVNRAIADQYKTHHIEITTLSRQASRDPGLLAGDGLHPSAREYGRWAAEIAALARLFLQQSPSSDE